jgi:hypothetical protein
MEEIRNLDHDYRMHKQSLHSNHRILFYSYNENRDPSEIDNGIRINANTNEKINRV